jgi:chromate transporter
VTDQTSLAELAKLFLRLGATAFGGPAAHIAIMEDEVVRRRRWLSEEGFLDLISAANLIPGPNSTELAIHIGWSRRGFAGLAVAGTAFIVPGMAITLAIAWAYVRFGTLPAAGALLYGIKPVILAVVAQAIWSLLPKAAKTWRLRLLGALSVALTAFGVSELVVLFGAGFVAVALANRRAPSLEVKSLFVPFLPIVGLGASAAPLSLPSLFGVFAKIGSILFGSGYVLLAFLRADLVDRLGWLTEAQLIDAVAVGQVTPGPVFTTATFVGYVLAETPGALVATAGIFLPAFVFVALSGPIVPRLRASRTAGAFLDGVNVASLALMIVVTAELARAALVDLPTIALGLAAAALLIRFKVNSTWLIAGGAAAGIALHALGLA